MSNHADDEEKPVTIREIVEDHQGDWARLREALWPGSLGDHEAETERYFAEPQKSLLIFVAEAEGRLVGFLYEEVECVVCFRKSLRDDNEL